MVRRDRMDRPRGVAASAAPDRDPHPMDRAAMEGSGGRGHHDLPAPQRRRSQRGGPDLTLRASTGRPAFVPFYDRTHMPILHIDFETRSTVSIKIVGAWRYATHAATDVWCAAFAIDDGEVKLWKPGDPVPQEIVTAANDPTRIVAAHNANFERQIIQHVMPRHGWPQIPLAQYRCTMASSSSCALPAALEKVAHELKLEHQKDTAGGRLMLQMSMPRRPRQDEDPSSTYWFDDPERLERLYRYCKQDVEVERELYHRLLPLIPGEQEIYAL